MSSISPLVIRPILLYVIECGLNKVNKHDLLCSQTDQIKVYCVYVLVYSASLMLNICIVESVMREYRFCIFIITETL